jgi:hypothetical protein
MNTNTAFNREHLKRVLDDVRAYRKSTGDRLAFKLTDAWVYKVGRDHWEFRFGKFYWHGSANNGHEARAKGWCAWLAAQELRPHLYTQRQRGF